MNHTVVGKHNHEASTAKNSTKLRLKEVKYRDAGNHSKTTFQNYDAKISEAGLSVAQIKLTLDVVYGLNLCLPQELRIWLLRNVKKSQTDGSDAAKVFAFLKRPTVDF